MKTVVYTIPGTGTRFLLAMLEKVFGYEQVHGNKEFLGPDRDDIYTQFHVQAFFGQPNYKEDYRLDDIPHDIPVITSLRHPHSSTLTRARYGDAIDWSLRRWEKLIRIAEGRKIFTVPVDVALSRAALIKNLGVWIDAPSIASVEVDELLENWAPVGSGGEGKNPITVTDEDLSKFDFAMEWYNQELKRQVRGE